MLRVKRQASKFGALDLADEVGREFDLPLNRISEKFSFDEATKDARKNRTLMFGRRTERMFEYVVASLGKADLITSEDSAAPLYAGAEVQAPDFFVSLKSGKKFFIEVKNTNPKTLDSTISLGASYLARLKEFARLKGHPLLVAVYWNNVRIWTINKIEDFETNNGTLNLRFPEAYQQSIAADFGDRMVAAVPPLVCRIHADPTRPSSIEEKSHARFTIGALSFYTEGREILSERERQIAFYLMFHSSWEEDKPVATMIGSRVDFVEIAARPQDDSSLNQEFQGLGTLAGMISSYYKWLTTANEEIARLTPQLEPAQLAPGFDDGFRGEVLRLWQFQSEPSYRPLIRG